MRVRVIPHETRSRSDNVLTGTWFRGVQQEPSMYLLASTHMWVTSTPDFVLYLQNQAPVRHKVLIAGLGFVRYSKNPRRNLSTPNKSNEASCYTPRNHVPVRTELWPNCPPLTRWLPRRSSWRDDRVCGISRVRHLHVDSSGLIHSGGNSEQRCVAFIRS